MNIFELLRELLPSGSGINGEWEFGFEEGKSIIASNHFELRDEAGGHEADIDFFVILYFDEAGHLEHEGAIILGDKDTRVLVDNHGVSAYLDDALCAAIYGG